MSSDTITLVCRPGRTDRTLVFAYTITNEAREDIYVMDALPSLDRQTRQHRADAHSVVVVLLEHAMAVVGKFVAPLPSDRRIAVPVIPLASRLAPGANLQRRIEVALPLAEASPYFPDLTLRDYVIEDIKTTLFTVGFWRAGTAGLATAAVHYAPELLHVVTPDPARDAFYATQRFPTNGLHIFKRRDNFPRSLVLGSALNETMGDPASEAAAWNNASGIFRSPRAG